MFLFVLFRGVYVGKEKSYLKSRFQLLFNTYKKLNQLGVRFFTSCTTSHDGIDKRGQPISLYFDPLLLVVSVVLRRRFIPTLRAFPHSCFFFFFLLRVALFDHRRSPKCSLPFSFFFTLSSPPAVDRFRMSPPSSVASDGASSAAFINPACS